jgi:hypothetical protein
MIDFYQLAEIAETEFADIVVSASVIDSKLRVVLLDSSYIDFWWSRAVPNRFAHHWERRHVDGSIYRHDNAPHGQWQHIATFPRHFHDQSDGNVVESNLSDVHEVAVRQFLGFARAKLAP